MRVEGSVAIIGDIHGQLYDMFYMLEKMQKSKKHIEKMVFMGDYVDRGMYGPEVMAYLCALKLEKGHDVVLLRGNHETRYCTDHYNFRQQCLQFYDEEVYDVFCEVFDNLPIAAIVNGRYVTMHGGITQRMNSLDDINRIPR